MRLDCRASQRLPAWERLGTRAEEGRMVDISVTCPRNGGLHRMVGVLSLRLS